MTDQQKIEELIRQLREYHGRLLNGRDYLMTVKSENLIIEDCFLAFGFTKSGF